MPKYRKKPIVIEAVRWTGDNWNAVIYFCGKAVRGDQETLVQDGTRMPVFIKTLEGEMRAELGDWIIKGVNGEFYPCKPDIFEKTYEYVPEPLAQ